MTEETKRAHIVCPIRGKQSGEARIDRSIELALEHDAHLSFLFVMDVDFLSHATVAKVDIVRDELRETASFVLASMSKRAVDRGVTSVDTHVRDGVMHDVIAQFAEEVGATHLVLGKPIRIPGVPGPPPGAMKKLGETLREECGIEVEYTE